MDLGHERAGRVEHREPTGLGVRVDVRRHAVRRQHHHGPLGDLGLLVDEHGPLGLQVPDDVQVVDDLLAHVHGGSVLGERLLDGLDRTVDAGAVAPRCRSTFLGMAPWYGRANVTGVTSVMFGCRRGLVGSLGAHGRSVRSSRTASRVFLHAQGWTTRVRRGAGIGRTGALRSYRNPT